LQNSRRAREWRKLKVSRNSPMQASPVFRLICASAFSAALPLVACAPGRHSPGAHGNSAANRHMHEHDFDELVRRFEHPERIAWQKPDLVIARLGPLQGRRVVDLGAGTGLFSMRLARAGATVTAVDIDPRFLNYIETRRIQAGLSETQLRTHLAKEDSAGLAENSADAVLVVNVYHHIENRTEYFRDLRKALRAGGVLLIVDFLDKETPIGPPPELRVSAAQAVRELQQAGFTKFSVDETAIEYQYILRAEN
jgi:2-polyprenyl-3-methyl-5-hydroxy-6-metoxy-1,4-benzoquinol methylase